VLPLTRQPQPPEPFPQRSRDPVPPSARNLSALCRAAPCRAWRRVPRQAPEGVPPKGGGRSGARLPAPAARGSRGRAAGSVAAPRASWDVSRLWVGAPAVVWGVRIPDRNSQVKPSVRIGGVGSVFTSLKVSAGAVFQRHLWHVQPPVTERKKMWPLGFIL